MSHKEYLMTDIIFQSKVKELRNCGSCSSRPNLIMFKNPSSIKRSEPGLPKLDIRIGSYTYGVECSKCQMASACSNDLNSALNYWGLTGHRR